jgi:UDP-N-acetylmuramate: L-alanyl-gamma-D-glutamyl-meso-diaminopimelate ligase
MKKVGIHILTFVVVGTEALEGTMRGNIESIHMIGICGVAMGSLAGMLKEKGYRVSGSDLHIYPPMSVMLEKWGIEVREGYRAEHVGSPDLVIVGNAVSRGNAEVEHVLNSRIPYASMAQALRELFLEGKEVVAVAGTHGKTTTTALLAHILETAGLKPSFFVGGVPKNYNSNYTLGPGPHFIIEGDEYDSAFFEKVPKFVLYRPQHLVLTSLEFDHADIYSSLDEIVLWFRRLVNMIPSGGSIVYSRKYEILSSVVSGSLSRCRSFGGPGADFSVTPAEGKEGRAAFRFGVPGGEPFLLESRLAGDFNGANIAAAAGMALLLGADQGSIQRGVASFEGVKRRQELIYEGGGLRIYEDFAHHPTAIAAVLRAMRQGHPGARLWAVYEPRSATSRRRVFQAELPGAFAAADHVVLKSPYRPEGIPEDDRIDIRRVSEAIRASGTDSAVMENVDDIVEMVFGKLDASSENVIVIMSNGGFDGIYAKMIARASARPLR